MAKALQEAVAAFNEYMEDNECPPCFSKDEYRIWQVLERDAPTVPVRGFICRDCSETHQKAMIKENRCFLRKWDDTIEGFRVIPVGKVIDRK